MDTSTNITTGSLLNKVYEMQCAQQQASVLTVVGGRMVSHQPPMLLNGQQLMMQLDCLTSAMGDMTCQEEPMEDSDEMTEEGDGEGPSSPYCQSGRRRDPVYLASMTAHSLPTQAQLQQHAEMQQQQHHLEQLQQQQLAQRQLEEQQLQYQLQLLHLQQHHNHTPHQLNPSPTDHQVPEMEESSLNLSLPLDSEFHCGSGRVLKRPDLIPMGDFI